LRVQGLIQTEVRAHAGELLDAQRGRSAEAGGDGIARNQPQKEERDD